jgi:hypothetical protein
MKCHIPLSEAPCGAQSTPARHPVYQPFISSALGEYTNSLKLWF